MLRTPTTCAALARSLARLCSLHSLFSRTLRDTRFGSRCFAPPRPVPRSLVRSRGFARYIRSFLEHLGTHDSEADASHPHDLCRARSFARAALLVTFALF